ncbi:TPA: hypothetical protein QDC20_003644 [Burkholderia aenigmatica]|uniref:hypothetical protein n=1 Tax=Burkholderia sp. AU45251 TaxID=3059204 RepID=UPI0026526AB4|nr:hypothetical protein [Burkholderia sp. AU45251]HDR9482827.1 hypothetical protein [Burkholderia aenigmatica]MDN7519489.1 hypothetical protein [Burkholderia sp. AU45251]HDR9513774.1 hypothetical protein [Burkholderia aenigmatica]HDR9591165.1 hypothetical protein [Burkholderia aenigmatica]HDR9599147.1 hypothetical protein [Burkholderia aenigmatica]
MSNHIEILASSLARAHADAIHNDLLPLAQRPDEPSAELVTDIVAAVMRHAERLDARLPG